MSSSIRVLLIEDHFLARIALRSVLQGRRDLEIAGEASDGEQGILMYRQLRPDVVLLDLRLPRVDGFAVIGRIRAEHRTARIVVLSNYQGSEDIYRALRAGALAYLVKDTTGEELLDAILAASRGIRYLPRTARDRLAERVAQGLFGGDDAVRNDLAAFLQVAAAHTLHADAGDPLRRQILAELEEGIEDRVGDRERRRRTLEGGEVGRR